MKTKIISMLIGLLFIAIPSFAGSYSTYGDASVVAATLNIPQFAGELYYVDGSHTDDTGSGLTPDTAKKTIGAAIAAAAAGDAITIKAGIYTEINLNLNKAGMELWFEIGSLIQPATGTALTISGASCAIKGMAKIIPASGQIGVLVSGTECHIEHIKVSTGGTGFQITGGGATIVNCAADSQTITAYDIRVGQVRLTDCKTMGVGATYGYLISNSADTGVLDHCTSVGHTTSGFYTSTGSSGWTILNCSSGAGDGRWTDVDSVNVWANFQYDDDLYSESTLDANNTTKSYNLFRIYGTVRVMEVQGHVETVLSANHTNCFIDLYDGSSVPLSKNTTLTLNAAPEGSFILRDSDATIILDYSDSTNAFISENSNYRTPGTEVVVGEKGDHTATYIRFTHTTTDAPSSGEIHWHIKWAPLTEDGFVVAQ